MFGIGGGSDARNLCGDENKQLAICLERGACVNWAHEHAASYLISRACKLAYEEYGWMIFFAYSDTTAGEIGTVYQACNWLYLGNGIGRNGNVKYRYEAIHKPTGQTYSARQVRYRRKNAPEYLKRLWDWEHLRQSKEWDVRKVLDKEKYVHFEGTKREQSRLKKLLRYSPIMPYPKR